jgi:outer membrane protein
MNPGLILGAAQHLGKKSEPFPGTILQGVQYNPMTSKFLRFLTSTAFALSATALAQTAGPAAGLPSAGSAGSATAPIVTGSGGKFGTINIEAAIFQSNEGQRESEELSKKLEPKQAQLKNLSDELDSLKKQLNAQQDKLNEEARNSLVKQIEQRQKVFDRTLQDDRDDAQNQQNEIAQKILQKMGPILLKYAENNGYGLIIDTSNPWPQGPVVYAGNSVDITKAIVEAYNTQSGVAPPATKPAATRPTGAAAKPAATPSSTPGTKP